MRLFLATLTVIAATSASAAPGLSTATLAAPAHAASVVTEGGIWHCEGTSCAGAASPMLREAVAACTGVASGAGRVTAFTAAGYAFTDADLVRCNRHVKG